MFKGNVGIERGIDRHRERLIEKETGGEMEGKAGRRRGRGKSR